MDDEEQQFYALQAITEIRDRIDDAQSSLSGFLSDHDARDLESAEAGLVSCLEDINEFLKARGGPAYIEPW